jgi:hypothetical protein
MEESVYEIMKRRGVNLDWYEKRRGLSPSNKPTVDKPEPLDLIKSIFLSEETVK